jgi:hypothetical protein
MPPTVYFDVALTCTNCGSLNDARSIRLQTSALGNDPTDTHLVPGETIELDDEEFDTAYIDTKPHATEPTFSAIELWGCRVCHKLRAARLQFRRRTPAVVEFVGATVVQLSTEVLDEARYVTRRLDEWSPLPGDDVERIAALEARSR